MSPRHASALTLEHVLLAALDLKPMHGYELYQALSRMEGISLIWNVKQALLYAILDKLESNGLLFSQTIPGETYPPRKYFHLTPAGKSSLQTWLKTPVRRARDIRQEFLAKMIVSDWYGKSEVLDLIHVQEQACLAWKEELKNRPLTLTQENADEWFVYSFRAQRVDGLLKWLKDCEQQVQQLIAQGG
jgi:PadR family transcriptional regulator PadR